MADVAIILGFLLVSFLDPINLILIILGGVFTKTIKTASIVGILIGVGLVSILHFMKPPELKPPIQSDHFLAIGGIAVDTILIHLIWHKLIKKGVGRK